MSIFKEVKETFQNGSILTKLIYINLVTFVCLRLIGLLFFLFNYNLPIDFYLSLPAQISQITHRPWTIITYMFMHNDLFHILFNILWLYWMGNIFLRYFNSIQLIGLYILGGLLGALLYIVSYNIFPVFSGVIHSSYLLGASASVLAVMTALASYAPNHPIRLMFIGNVKISHLAIITILIYAIDIGINNPGGNIAHIGGALCGYLFVSLLKKRIDITIWISNLGAFINKRFKRKSKIHISYKNTDGAHHNKAQSNQIEINKVLDKINKSGYNSLSKEEKELLFKMGE